MTINCTVPGVQPKRCIPCAQYHKSCVQRTSKRPTQKQRLMKSSATLRIKCKNILQANSRNQKKVDVLKYSNIKHRLLFACTANYIVMLKRNVKKRYQGKYDNNKIKMNIRYIYIYIFFF